MNCKPKEMATVVRRSSPLGNIPESWLGLTVQVDHLVSTPFGQTWMLVHPVKAVCAEAVSFMDATGRHERVIPAGTEIELHCMPDDYLQPWRGSDTQRERAEPISLMQPRGHSYLAPVLRKIRSA